MELIDFSSRLGKNFPSLQAECLVMPIEKAIIHIANKTGFRIIAKTEFVSDVLDELWSHLEKWNVNQQS